MSAINVPPYSMKNSYRGDSPAVPEPNNTDENVEPQAAGEAPPVESNFRPLTRGERRNLWLKEYGEQDFALQMWVRLVEAQDLNVEMMFQMHGLLVFGVMVSTARYAQFYIELNEELNRHEDPDTPEPLA